MKPVERGRSYHLIHRSGWRDPLEDFSWEAEFLRHHPTPAAALLTVFWASLLPASPIPKEYRINSLADLETAANGDRRLDYDVARRAIMAPSMGPGFWSHRDHKEPVSIDLRPGR